MNAKTREHQPSPPHGRRRCEDCAEADVERSCECCGQEQCRSCWADGDGALCGGCRGRSWDEVPPEDSVTPVGLLVADDEQQWAPAR